MSTMPKRHVQQSNGCMGVRRVQSRHIRTIARPVDLRYMPYGPLLQLVRVQLLPALHRRSCLHCDWQLSLHRMSPGGIRIRRARTLRDMSGRLVRFKRGRQLLSAMRLRAIFSCLTKHHVRDVWFGHIFVLAWKHDMPAMPHKHVQ